MDGLARTVTAAAIQIAPDLTSGSGTVDRMLSAIGEAASRGVQLAVFPEACVPYYPYFSFVVPPALAGPEHMRLYEEAVQVPGPETALFAASAREHGMVLVVGVNERDHGSLYNSQLIFDADGELVHQRRKLTPSYHERMIWGQGDGSGLAVAQTAVGRIGALACWEHYSPLARYVLMTEHEQIHCAQFPGSMVGDVFAQQIEVTIRHHALEAGCFVVNATGWLTNTQIESITPDDKLRSALRSGCFTAIVSPEGRLLGEVLTEGEGMVVATLDMSLITKRKRMLDSVGHYARPDLFEVYVDRSKRTTITDRPASFEARRSVGDEHAEARTAGPPVDAGHATAAADL